jgi:selenocysteine lyase/cysteine desulfurase
MDLERIRAETPGTKHVVHLNNCGAGLMPQPVLDAVKSHLDLEANIGGYEAAAQANGAIEHCYDAIAALLNCHRDEIAVVENATVAWCAAFYGMRFQKGDRVLTAAAEYASNYISYLQLKERVGIEVEVVPNDNAGQLDVNALANMIDDKVRLISVTHAPTGGGLINPAAAIGKIARSAGIPYLLDACQSVGQMPLNVEEIGCDMLSATGRKYLRGPRGTGFLYVRAAMLDRLDPPVLDLHSAKWTAMDRYEMQPNARRFENWENFLAGKIGLGVAVDYALDLGLDNIATRTQMLAQDIRDRLDAISGVQTHDLGVEKSGIVSFSVQHVPPDEVKARMAAEKINISTSTVFSTRADLEPRGIPIYNRLGVHYYNSEAEVDRFINAIKSI